MSQLASLEDAQTFFNGLPEQLETYFDEAYQKAFDHIIIALNEFFNITLTIDKKSEDNARITPDEASDIGEHGFVLLLKLIDLMEKLDLPQKRREIEQTSLIFAHWTIRHNGHLNHIEPIVNALAQAANTMHDKQSLRTLEALMGQVIDACSEQIKYDLDSNDQFRPWRLLHINRCIVATRTHDTEIMHRAFDELIVYLPTEAHGFFTEGIQEMDELDYPPEVRKVIERYNQTKPSIRLH